MMYLLTPEQHAQIVEVLSDERYVSQYSHIVEALAMLKAMQPVEPCDKQFQARDGTWYGFHNEEHYNNTVADGSWPIREVYTPTKD